MSDITIPQRVIKFGETYSGNDTDVVVKGTASACTVTNGAKMAIESGGTAKKTNVVSYGYIDVYSKGTVISSVLSSGGRLFVYSGGQAKSPP